MTASAQPMSGCPPGRGGGCRGCAATRSPNWPAPPPTTTSSSSAGPLSRPSRCWPRSPGRCAWDETSATTCSTWLAGQCLLAAPAQTIVHPGLLELLDRLAGTPAQVITDLHVTLVQNPLAVALLGPAVAATGPRASFVYRWFADLGARSLYPEADHAQQAAQFVADLRAAAGRRAADDPDITAIVGELSHRSAEFATLSERHDVAVRRKDRKRLVHPAIGTIEVNCLNLFSEDHRQRLLWFTPVPGTAAIEQLELLTVLGTQAMTAL